MGGGPNLTPYNIPRGVSLASLSSLWKTNIYIYIWVNDYPGFLCFGSELPKSVCVGMQYVTDNDSIDKAKKQWYNTMNILNTKKPL